MEALTQIELDINGQLLTLAVEKNWTLLHVLREVLDLTGTKCGCLTGDCGSCKILLDGQPVNACLVKATASVGKKIETIESLSKGAVLHPIQQAFIDAGAVQCGYCIPGMVMTAKSLLARSLSPTDQEIREALSNNLCRCTGYVKIVEAIHLAAARLRAQTQEGTTEK